MTTHYTSCPLCEATCGIAVEVDGDRVVSIRGDEHDPFSRGYMCPKGSALADLHHDPDRLRHPMRRDGDTWHELGWDEALDLVARKLTETRAAHGKHAIGVYQGNPTAHNLGLVTYGQLLLRTLGTKNMYSATSLDQLPHMLAALQMFGNQLLIPVPDVDRCDLFICLGANPLASNGSLMTAPDMRGRLKSIQRRGGRVIVLDPRRTETAARADAHHFIRPGTDAVLLLAIIHALYAGGMVKPGRIATTGDAELRDATSAWTPERAAPITGISAADIRELARLLATTRRAVLYGRIGVCTQACELADVRRADARDQRHVQAIHALEASRSSASRSDPVSPYRPRARGRPNVRRRSRASARRTSASSHACSRRRRVRCCTAASACARRSSVGSRRGSATRSTR